MELIVPTTKGLYCPIGDFYIDPTRGVEKALITHAHTDHARKGSKHYFASTASAPFIKKRINKDVHAKEFNEQFMIENVKISFHPAGHIKGSAQVRLEYNNEVWVVSGDYKREQDPSCEQFELVPCHVFITEATFGKEHYIWPDKNETLHTIMQWWQHNKKRKQASVLYCYVLGKAQRILAELAKHTEEEIVIHANIQPYCQLYQESNVQFPKTTILEESNPEHYKEKLIIAPSQGISRDFLEESNAESAYISGWTIDSSWKQKGFIMSDHADYPALMRTAQETKAKKVFTMHGFDKELAKSFRKKGIHAQPIKKELFEQIQASLHRFI